MRASRSALLLCALGLSACNSGLGLFATGDDSNDSPSFVSGFTILDPETSPATVSFRVIDADGGAPLVSLFYELPGATPKPLSALVGARNPANYAASANGVEHQVLWDFAAEPDFPDDASLVEDVRVFALITGSEEISVGSNASELHLGNDAPVVGLVGTPDEEVFGVVPIEFEVADSSTDLVSVRVEYRLEGEDDWQLARPGGLSSTPEFALTGLSAPAGGASVIFFWDTTVDLPELERDVRLRFTPADSIVEGDPTVSETFRVDNNAAPIVFLDNGLIAVDGGDSHGGIALPFTVIDAESNDVRVLFQYTRPGEGFPELPEDPDEVWAIQADPVLRKQYQVCSERVLYCGGRPFPVDANRVRLPELGTSQVPVLTPDLVGRELEILRGIEQAVTVSDRWGSPPFTRPIAAVPVGDGLECVVLDETAPGSWSLVRIVLATGEVLEQIASGSGAPTALDLAEGAQMAFVGLDLGATWGVDRIDLATGGISGTARDLNPGGGVRGLAALSPGRVCITTGEELREISFATKPARITTVIAGLAEPRGVAVDPLQLDVVAVCERGAGRVLEVDVRRRVAGPIVTADPTSDPAAQLDLPAPLDVAFDLFGKRMLVISEVAGGRELRALNRRSAHDVDGSGGADPLVHVLSPVSDGTSSVATGEHRLRVLVDPDSNGLTAIGGIEQRRTISFATPTDTVVEVAEAFDPPLEVPRTWRVKRGGDTFQASPDGTIHTFAWDSRDVPRGGDITFRARVFDSEFGVGSATVLGRLVTPDFGRRFTLIDPTVMPPASLDEGTLTHPVPSLVDFDRDGDLDVLISEGADSRVYLQQAPGEFASTAVPVGVNLVASSLAPLLIEDIDGDGELDLAHARTDFSIDVFRGTGPGTFDPVPATNLVLPGTPPKEHDNIVAMELCDLDGDGDRDLLVSNVKPTDFEKGQDPLPALVAFRQLAPLVFEDEPTAVGEADIDARDRRQFVSGDVDADGRMDVLVADAGEFGTSSSGELVIEFQDAQGEFEKLALAATDEDRKVRTVALADLDQDGDLDVIAGHGAASVFGPGGFVPAYSGRITIFWQVAPREFASEPTILVSPSSQANGLGHLNSVDVGDMNDDGLLDIVGFGRDGVLIFFAEAPGVFDPTPWSHPFLQDPEEPTLLLYRRSVHPIAPQDIDGDGDLDLLFRDLFTGEVEILFQYGRGLESFDEDPTELTLQAFTDGAIDCVAADFDSDGDLDIASSNAGLAGNSGSNNFTIFAQTAPREFVSTPLSLSTPPGSLEGPATTNPTQIEAADMDQDGDRDLIGVTERVDFIRVYFQDEDATFEESVALGPFLTDPADILSIALGPMNSLAIGDVESDGDLDIVAASGRSSQAIVWEQTSAGVFEEGLTLDGSVALGEPEASPRAITLGDLDDDGSPEVLMNTLVDTPQSLLIFAGLEGRAAPLASVGPGAHDQTRVADLDGDGRLDLIGSRPDSEGNPQVLLSLQQPDGSFATVPLEINATGNGMASRGDKNLWPADLDSDGDLDLCVVVDVVGNFPGANIASIAFFEQVAPGRFAKRPRQLPFGGSSLLLDDVDGDGELDIVTASFMFFGAGRTRVSWGNE